MGAAVPYALAAGMCVFNYGDLNPRGVGRAQGSPAQHCIQIPLRVQRRPVLFRYSDPVAPPT
jgi:hypothetical protein